MVFLIHHQNIPGHEHIMQYRSMSLLKMKLTKYENL